MKNNNQLNALDEHFMNIALQEAAKANHKVFPNPKVGALIVVDDKIISKGYHKCYGEDHAEANAISHIRTMLSCREKEPLYRYYKE